MLRIGIIGTNTISDNLVNNAKTVEGVEICSVYSRKEETGRAFADRHGILSVYTDLDAFLSDETMDAVYVASPNSFHASQSIAALEHGKHVLCEKPIASNEEEYKAVKKLALSKNLIFLEAMRPFFDPVMDQVREEMTKLGAIRHARFEYCQMSTRYNDFKNGVVLNAFNPALSNASVMDIGVYCLAWCVMLFGKPESITSASAFLKDFEGNGTGLLRYGPEFYAEIHYSKTWTSVFPTVINGEKGSVAFGPKLNSPAFMTTYLSGEEPVHRTIDYSPFNIKFEVAEFKRLVEEGVAEHTYYPIMDTVIALLDEIRAQNGIRFPADGEK